MAETNASGAAGYSWENAGSVLWDKGLDLVDSIAALQIGRAQNKLAAQTAAVQAQAAQQNITTTAPAPVAAVPNKTIYWVAGGIVALLVLVLALKRK